jgi:hypothetical protein
MLAESTNEERAGIEERYTSATNTSDLTVDTRHRRPVDDIIAAGWSRSRIGAALLRLHSEWDGSEKPQKATPEALQALAESFPREKGGLVAYRMRADAGREVTKLLKPLEAAQRQAQVWHLHELGLLFQKLKTLPEVRQQLVQWCGRVGMSGGPHKVAEVISWWLDPTCHVCDGQKWELIPGTRSHSNRTCRACHGSGEAYLPHGQDGRKMLRFINDCLQAARASMRGRFRHQQTKD